MDLLKKCVENDRLRASRNKGQHSSMPVRQAVQDDSSEIKPDGPSAGRLAFVIDFTREHSHHNLYLTSIEISGSF